MDARGHQKSIAGQGKSIYSVSIVAFTATFDALQDSGKTPINVAKNNVKVGSTKMPAATDAQLMVSLKKAAAIK